MANRFDVQQHEDGQVYISESGEQMHHVKINGPHNVDVQVGVSGRATIDKLYGPLVFWPIRVSLDVDACEWVIEREFGPSGEWREVARIPGQLEEDFSPGDETCAHRWVALRPTWLERCARCGSCRVRRWNRYLPWGHGK